MAERRPKGWWKPERKWYALLVTGVSTIAGSWIVTGVFDVVERGMAATLIAGLASVWATGNAKEDDREAIRRRLPRRRPKDPATLEGGSSHMRK